MIELVLSIFLGEGWGWGEMQMYYSPCLTKHPSGSVNMPSVLVYFTFNDLGIKRSHYTFRPYPVDFFFTHLVSVSWLAFFLCEYLADGFTSPDPFHLNKFDHQPFFTRCTFTQTVNWLISCVPCFQIEVKWIQLPI